MTKTNLHHKIKKTDPHCRGQYIFICFAEYEGQTLIVFRDVDKLSVYAKTFNEDSQFIPFEKDDEFRFDIVWDA